MIEHEHAQPSRAVRFQKPTHRTGSHLHALTALCLPRSPRESESEILRLREASGRTGTIGQGSRPTNAATVQRDAVHALASVCRTRNSRESGRISPFTEAVVLTRRGLLLRWRDPSTSYARLAVTLITALLPSFIFYR